MSTHKHIDRICCAALVLVLLITVLFVNAKQFGVESVHAEAGYETRLFDTSSVHTIDIVMDEWEDFLETCENEEYAACSVVIDGEAYKNVGIRAKGNTSLSSVAAYGNNRYSFKIEFDQYDNTKSYYGLDKISLNNIIQDNTYMKDYLCYQMMGAFGVPSSLCSYVYITVNGEDWGLYLAVEGVEESFLQRNYGSDYGELYKPDSTDMGGGRGNGAGFDPKEMDDLFKDNESSVSESEDTSSQATSDSASTPENDIPSNSIPDGGTPPDGATGFGGKTPPDGAVGFGGGTPPDGSTDFGGGTPPDGTTGFDGQTPPDGMTSPARNPFAEEDTTTDNSTASQRESTDTDAVQPTHPQDGTSFGRMDDGGRQGGKGGGMSMGSDDVSLIYTDNDYDSYSNIFDNAKTDITDSDKGRLIDSLCQLNANENIENVVDVEEVIRYFVVHNFVCNFDSYTGSIIHNYYLYEEDGQLSMIPWDYNLAFGGFQSMSDATSLVNYPIDTPVSGGTVDSRPMLAWIFANEEYTELYHQYFAEFISFYFDSGCFETMMDTVSEMLAPYVEQDPTKFCTYDEFETGISTLKEFCLLRAESISGQLDGTIPTTSDERNQDNTSLVDASDLSISAMGSMGNTMGGGQGGGRMNSAPNGAPDNTGEAPTQPPDNQQNADTANPSAQPAQTDSGSDSSESIENGANGEQGLQQQPGRQGDDFTPGDMPDTANRGNMAQMGNPSEPQASNGTMTWVLLGVSGAVLLAGLFFAWKFKR